MVLSVPAEDENLTAQAEDLLWQAAAEWLWRARKKAPASADIWLLRWRWPETGKALFRVATEGRYRLSPMLVCGWGKTATAMWSAQDALVLKWVVLRVEKRSCIQCVDQVIAGNIHAR